jgi:hypothetical protein
MTKFQKQQFRNGLKGQLNPIIPVEDRKDFYLWALNELKSGYPRSLFLCHLLNLYNNTFNGKKNISSLLFLPELIIQRISHPKLSDDEVIIGGNSWWDGPIPSNRIKVLVNALEMLEDWE